MEKIEKELKFKIDNSELLIKVLLSKGAIILNKSKEKTVRFDTPGLDLEKRGVFLRVREGSKKTITLKEKIGSNEQVRTRRETEFEIENIGNMQYILEKLGFNFVRIFEKYRINLSYKNSVLSIDELPFGIFLEIEGDEEEINSIALELGYKIEDKILCTYWDLFEEFKRSNNSTEKDILFPAGWESTLIH